MLQSHRHTLRSEGSVSTLIFFFLFVFSKLCALEIQDKQEEISGFWKTINEKTNKPEAMIAIYEYQGSYFGRIMMTYLEDGSIQDTINHPKKRAPGVLGNPFYAGLDIIWDLKQVGNKYKEGKILDPEKGYIYQAEAWKKGAHLIVRGKFFVFGRNQTWQLAEAADFPEDFKKPDLSSFIPVIPNVNERK